MSLILPWVLFPLVLAALGLGWGRLVELASGARLEGALLVYGAPVLLSGQANFLGYIRLDDTGTWFNIIDNVMSHRL